MATPSSTMSLPRDTISQTKSQSIRSIPTKTSFIQHYYSYYLKKTLGACNFIIASVIAGSTIFYKSDSESYTSTLYWSFMNAALSYTIFKIFSILFVPLSFRLLELFLNKKKHADYGNRDANMIAGIANGYTRRFLHLQGTKQPIQIPDEITGLIVVLNHPSGGVEFFAAATSIPRPVTAIATIEVQRDPKTKWFGDIFNLIYVNFDKGQDGKKYPDNQRVVDDAAAALKQGATILISPYGAIHPPGSSEPKMLSGFVRMAKKANEELLAEGKKPSIGILKLFVSGFDPKRCRQQLGSLLPWPFTNNRIAVDSYGIIPPEDIMRLPTEEIMDDVATVLSMVPNAQGKLRISDPAHDSVARLAMN